MWAFVGWVSRKACRGIGVPPIPSHTISRALKSSVKRGLSAVLDHRSMQREFPRCKREFTNHTRGCAKSQSLGQHQVQTLSPAGSFQDQTSKELHNQCNLGEELFHRNEALSNGKAPGRLEVYPASTKIAWLHASTCKFHTVIGSAGLLQSENSFGEKGVQAHKMKWIDHQQYTISAVEGN